MKRVAIFGNAGGGKSTLARELSAITGLPLYVIDKLQYRVGGSAVPHEEYLQAHSALLKVDQWIIDGFGGKQSAWERFAAADTLIHVDLPLKLHFLGVTRRLLSGFFVPPEGWPQGSPLISSSIQSYKVLVPCNRHLTPKYRAYTAEVAKQKRVVHLRSRKEMKEFLESVRREIRITGIHSDQQGVHAGEGADGDPPYWVL